MSAHTADAVVSDTDSFRIRMRRIISADHANVAPSATNAQPGPMVPTSSPPTSGPITRMQAGRTNWPSAFASTSSPSGTIEGMIELKAGLNRACPTPKTTTRAISIGTVSTSRTERNPIVVIAASRMRSPAIIRWRRSSRSDSAPLASTRKTWGRAQAMPTFARVPALFSRWSTWSAIATM
ncbi:MAG: hypothetical protein U0V56_02655 [Actinomycetota bacterium]